MKAIALLFMLSQLTFSQKLNQEASAQIIFGMGLRGITGGESKPVGYTISFGLRNDRAGFLSTLSYAENELTPLVRFAGISTQLLFRVSDSMRFSLGPEINITILGLMKLDFIGAIHYAFADNDSIIPYIGYSDVGSLNCGITFTL